MDPIATILLSLGGLGLFLMASGFAARRRRKARGRGAGPSGASEPSEPGFEPAFEAVARRVEGRLAAIEARLDGGGGAEDRLQAMATQLLGLIRDKNATLETALAGLDQLRARMKTIEQMGSAAEARGLFEGLVSRLDMLESAQAAAGAALEAGLARRPAGEGPDPQAAAVMESLTRLYAQKDAGLAARLDALQSRMDMPAENPFAEISAQLTRLYAQKDATTETVLARLAPLEAKLAEIEARIETRDPRAALDGFAARLDALQSRMDVPEESPFAEISAQLTRLYAQKDATTETVLARLGPLEAQLAALQGEMATRDPKAALAGFAARLDALQSQMDVPAESPFAEISAQLTRLYAQKDATVETVFARLAPLEARLAGIEALAPQVAAIAEADPRVALDDFAVRLETLHWTQGEVAAGLAALRAALGDGNMAQPFAAIAEQLTLLHAQKEAGLAALEARLAPLEARLAAMEEPGDEEAAADTARAEAREIADQLAGLRAAAAQTELFADRLAVIEASLPRLNAAQSQMLRALERQSAGGPAAPEAPPAAPDSAPTDPFAAFRDLPRIVSLHQK